MDKIIRDNEPLIHVAVIEHFPLLKIDEDIMQLGRIGIWKAAKTFDETKDAQFAHYAVSCIKNEIARHFQTNSAQKRVLESNALHLEDPVPGSEEITLGDMIEANPHSSFVDWDGIKSALSPRELEVLQCMMAGYNGQEIGNKFGFSRERSRQIMNKIRKIVKEYV